MNKQTGVWHMSNKGRIQLDRGIFEHEAFARHQFSQREAWIWLLCEAAWEAKNQPNGGCVQRGQLCRSQRFMAKTFGWSRGAVIRFLARLQELNMVRSKSDPVTDPKTIQLTICNYDRYQLRTSANRSKVDPVTDPISKERKN